MKNLDLFIFLIKNWPNDPASGIEDKQGPNNVHGFDEVEEEILDIINTKFYDQVEDHVKDYVQNWNMYP